MNNSQKIMKIASSRALYNRGMRLVVAGQEMMKRAQDAAASEEKKPEAAPDKGPGAVRRAWDATAQGVSNAAKWTKDQAVAGAKWVNDWGKNNRAGAGGAIGAGAGAIAGLLYEAIRRKKDDEERKHYLKAALMTAITAGAGGAVVGHFAPNIANWSSNVANAIAGKSNAAPAGK